MTPPERNPRKLKWTKSFRKAHGKEMTVDSTLAFAARRNVPVRYNRDLVQTTLKAMERVTEIRSKRERVFYRKRMEGNKSRSLAEDKKLVEEHQHLLPPSERYIKPNLDSDEEEEELEDMEMAMEDVMDDEMDSDMELDEEEEELAAALKKQNIKSHPKQKGKSKMLVGGGTVRT
jgi:large subunit ribosomal protein L24e